MEGAASRKLYVLDAMRGIAALAVVQLHTQVLFGGAWFHHAGLAVDFFFMLSGFVLSFAYQQRLDQGWSTGEFLKARLIRLYPLYALGLLIAGLFYALRSHFGHEAGTIHHVLLLLVLATLFIPAPAFLRGTDGLTFPLNPPTWSLFYEAFANVAHAFFLRRTPLRYLAAIAAVSGAVLVAAAFHLGTIDCGLSQDRFVYGFARITFSYTAGMLVWVLWTRWKLPRNISPLVPALLLLAVLLGPARSAVWFDMLGVVFPAILYLGASSKPAVGLVPALHWLGVTSYALYVLHEPLFQWFILIQSRAPKRLALAVPWTGCVFLCLLGLGAYGADRLFDAPVRSFLRARFSKSAR